MEKVLSIVKSLIMRGMVIYFVMTMFKRPTPTPTDPNNPNAPTQLPRGAASNLFVNGTIFDLYVFLSEDPELIGNVQFF